MNTVIYEGCVDSQVDYGGHDDPRGILEIGKEYELEEVIVHSCSTDIKLKDIDGLFNSVCFLEENDFEEYFEEWRNNI